MDNITGISIKTNTDPRGSLSVLELKDYVDWEAKRIYYLTDVKEDRGGHAVKNEKKFYVCVKGTVKAKLHDGNKWHFFTLNGPNEAILANCFCYRVFSDFSDDCVLVAISSVNYVPEDYVYNFDEFLNLANK